MMQNINSLKVEDTDKKFFEGATLDFLRKLIVFLDIDLKEYKLLHCKTFEDLPESLPENTIFIAVQQARTYNSRLGGYPPYKFLNEENYPHIGLIKQYLKSEIESLATIKCNLDAGWSVAYSRELQNGDFYFLVKK